MITSVDNKRPSKRKSSRIERGQIIILGLITSIGFLLRIFQLGRDDFWIDEAGVALAMLEPTIPEMMAIVHNHVMAMPLDYIIAWLFTRLHLSEFVLRLPAVIWGTLTLPVIFFLTRKMAGNRVALTAMIFMTLMPIHIQYSQEARFYAPLIFFYSFANLLLLNAIQTPTKGNWVLFTVFTIIGIYFHVFVILCILNAVGWLWFSSPKHEEWQSARLYLVRSIIVILLAFLVSIFAFGTVYTYDIPLLLFENSIWETVGTGVGIIPFYPSNSGASWIFGLLLLVFAGIGVVRKMIVKPKGTLSLLLYSSVAQGVFVIALNILKSYFLAPRQFLFFLPTTMIFSAVGVDVLVKRLSGSHEVTCSSESKEEPGFGLQVNVLYIALVVILVNASLPAIWNYYQGDKGETRQILGTIQQYAEKNAPVFFIPDYKSNLFAYYAFYQPSDESFDIIMIPSDWETIRVESADIEGKQFLVSDLPLEDSEKDTLMNLGFEPLFIPEKIHTYSQGLWIIPGDENE